MIYEFQATQSFNGYDEPWAPGTKYNLADLDNPVWSGSSLSSLTTYPSRIEGDSIVSGGQQGFNTGSCFTIPVNENETYTVSCIPKNQLPFSWLLIAVTLDSDNVWTSNVSLVTVYAASLQLDTRFYETVTIPEGYTHLAIAFFGSTKYGSAMNKPQIVEGSEDLPYLPYANVCMPEGFNIWDPTAEEFIQVYAGYVNSNTRELYLRPVYEEYAGEELVGPWMSSLDPYEEDTTPTEGAFVIDFGGELTSYDITPFMLQTLLDSLGIRQHFTDGAGLLNSLMDQAQGRVRSEEELLHLSRPLNVIAIGDQLPSGITFKPISKDVLPGLPGKFIR